MKKSRDDQVDGETWEYDLMDRKTEKQRETRKKRWPQRWMDKRIDDTNRTTNFAVLVSFLSATKQQKGKEIQR